MKGIMACKFDKAWVGPCGKETDNDYCTEHAGKKCVSCGEQATHECPTASSLVCGAPLCDKCFHEPWDKADFCHGKDGRHGYAPKCGVGTASAGLPGYAGDNNGERK